MGGFALNNVAFFLFGVLTALVLAAAAACPFYFRMKKKLSEYKFKSAIIDSIPHYIAADNTDGEDIFANDAAYRMIGAEKGAPLTKEQVHDEKTLSFMKEAAFPIALRDGVWSGECVIRRSDGEKLDVKQSIFPVYDRGGHRLGSATIMLDITEEKLLQRALSIKSSLLESSQDFIVAADTDFKIIYANPGAYKMTGYSSEEVGLDITPDLVHDTSTTERVLRGFESAIRGNVVIGESRLIKKDGTRIEVQSQIFPIYSSNRKSVGIGCIMRDISDLKKYQREMLVKSAIIESSRDFIAATDRNMNCVYGNPGAYTMSGYSPEEIGLDIGPDRMHDEKTAEKIKAACYNSIFHGIAWQDESEFICKDGTIIDIQQQLFPLKDENGEITGTGTIIRDISDIKAAQQMLSDVNRRYEIALSASSSGIWDVDLKNSVVTYDQNTALLFGLDILKKKILLSDLLDVLRPSLSDNPYSSVSDFCDVLTGDLSGSSDPLDFSLGGPGEGGCLLRCHRKTLMGEDGTPLRTVCMVTDITHCAELERENELLRKELEDTLKAGGAG